MGRTPVAAALLLIGCTVGTVEPPVDASVDATAVDALDATDGAADASVPDPWDRTLDAIARAHCELAIACEAFLGTDAWRLGFERSCHPRGLEARDAIERALRAGRVRLDDAAAAECIEALAPGRYYCLYGPRGPFDLPECASALVPLVPPGGACDTSRGREGREDVEECVPGYRCADAPGCGARCVPHAEIGEPCDLPSDCAPSLDCEWSLCTRDPIAGDPCTADEHCGVRRVGRALFCVDDVCATVAPVGENGDCSRFPCADGLLCVEGVCSDPAAPISCAYPEMCDFPRGTCSYVGFCTIAPGLGEPCDPRVERTCLHACADPDGTGFRCSDSYLHAACSLTAPICVPFGLTCLPSPFAPTGYGTCERALVEGGECESSRDCTAGTRCADARCREIAMPGETCGIDRVCPLTYACIGHCVPRPWIGEPCDDELTCFAGQCVDGTCEWADGGEPCELHPASIGPCHDYCAAHGCNETLPDGELCSFDLQCAHGSVCRAHDDDTRRCALPCP